MARVRAPELLGRGGWIGAVDDFSLSALSGKVVVLHFWRASSVNCVRVLDELRPIEERFASEAVVVGVHSPKFPHEHEHAAVERAVERLGIRHAVLDDPDLTTWQQYGGKGWPTLVVIDPEGYVVGGIAGEGNGPVVFNSVEQTVADHDGRGTLVRGPVGGLWGSGAVTSGFRAVAFPGQVALDHAGRRLAVCDTGNGRVLVSDLSGRVEHVYPLFTRPHGVAFDGDRLLVCDTGTDRVVAVDRATGMQQVVADQVASPWNVTMLSDGSALFTEAGRHRLWRIPADGSGPVVVAGTGREDLVDGRAADGAAAAADGGAADGGAVALLAQPGGVAGLPGGGAVFVDAESSALRVLTPGGEVVTLVGQGLFDFGASDGGPDAAALQYPLAVAVGPAPADGLPAVYVADTYNGAVREWTGTAWAAGAGTLRTLAPRDLDEPEGLVVLPTGALLVSDTNHHQLVIAGTDASEPRPLVLDETWLGTAVGPPFVAGAGQILRLPFAFDAGRLRLDDAGGPPVRVDVIAEPGSLLGPGPRRWATAEAEGGVDLVAGRAGEGVVVVEVEVSVLVDDVATVLRGRTRHDLTVSPASPDVGAAAATGLDRA